MRSADTDPETERVATVIGLARQAIRRGAPEATDTEVGLLFVERHYGHDLAAALRRHLARSAGDGALAEAV